VVATNESLKEWLNPDGQHDMRAYLLSGAGAGALAAAVTNPLDVVKTRLQTQSLSAPAILRDARRPAGAPCGAGSVQMASYATHSHATPEYRGFFDAVRKIYGAEGVAGFAKGLRPRLLMHTPSVAISWGTYEFVKNFMRGGDQSE